MSAQNSFVEEPVESEPSAGPAAHSREGSSGSASHSNGAAGGAAAGAPAAADSGPNWAVGDDAEGSVSPSSKSRSGLTGKEHAPGRGSTKAPEELQQRYLRLLNTGKLASKEKLSRSAGSGTLRDAAAAGASLEDPKVKSVYETDIARLRSTAKHLEVSPLQTTGAAQASTTAGRASSAPRARSGGGGANSTVQGASGGLALGSTGGGGGSGVFRKLYSPGPGSYSPAVDRHGGWDGSAFGFGTARQRPANACIQEYATSPGPVYMPTKRNVSTSPTSPTFRFGKRSVGSRTDLNADMASNTPHWNPGPGTYEALTTATGAYLEPGVDAPRTIFGGAAKLVTPGTNLAATVFVSKEHAYKENMGVHSPGPGQYSPGHGATQPAAASFTIAAKAPSFFEVDPSRQASPGPVYHTGNLDHRSNKTWGSQPRATFGKGYKSWDPELNLSGTVFISHLHAQHVNQGVHSPGPIYKPARSSAHVPTPLLMSGPKDRFYDRFEPGRIQ